MLAQAFSKKRMWGSANEGYGSSGLSVDDLNRDGKPDLIYTNGDGPARVDAGSRALAWRNSTIRRARGALSQTGCACVRNRLKRNLAGRSERTQSIVYPISGDESPRVFQKGLRDDEGNYFCVLNGQVSVRKGAAGRPARLKSGAGGLDCHA